MAKASKSKGSSQEISVDENTIHQMIEKKAYEIYERRGKEDGRDLDDWMEAEQLIRIDSTAKKKRKTNAKKATEKA